MPSLFLIFNHTFTKVRGRLLPLANTFVNISEAEEKKEFKNANDEV
jgi:hypothetical protein